MPEDQDFFSVSALERPLMVSYAGNHEDVRLRRVVPLLPSRTYVDVGAGDPIDGSVTYWLYEQGWRGVLVEPGNRSALLASVRPEDVVVEAAVGAPPDGIFLFETAPDPGMSTIRRDRLPELASLGQSWAERRVPSVSLQEIFEEHTREPVSLLSVDVEGAEQQVLDSLDWSSHRPAVVVVESIEPWRPVSTHHDWQHILLEAGYRLAAFDGINRFFVDGQTSNADQITDALAYPLSALDRYISADEQRARDEIAGLSEDLRRSISTQTRLNTELHDVRADLARAQQEVRRVQGKLDRADADRQSVAQARVDLDQANEEIRRLREQKSLAESRIRDLESAADEREQYIVALTGAHRDLERRHREVLDSRTWRYVVPLVHRARRQLSWLRPVLRLLRALRQPEALRRELLPWARRQARLGVLWLQGPERRRERAVAKHTHPAFLGPESRPPSTGAPPNATWTGLATQRLADADHELLMRVQNDGQVRRSLDRQIQLAALAEEVSKSGKARPPASSERSAVLFDARCLQEPSLATRGVGRYALEALQQLRNHIDERQLYLFTDASLPAIAFEVGDVHCVEHIPPQLRRRIRWFVQPSPVTADSWQLTPILNDAGVHCTTICYDFIPAKYPACYFPAGDSRLLHDARQQSLRLYDEVWAISHATREELRSFVGQPAEEFVVWPAKAMETAPAKATLSVSLPDRYVLIAVGDEHRKNVIGGLGAVAHLRGARRDVTAVLLGWSGATDRVMEWAAEVGLPEHAVVILPHLPPSEVAAVRKGAQASLVPSFDEGLSLPVVESVEDRTPVVASRIAAHQELLGDGPWLAPPWRPSELGDALKHVLANKAAVLQVQAAALAEHRHLSVADAVTARFGQILKTVAERTPLHRNERPSLGVVTPWPPQASGIADYSAFTLSGLGRHVDAVFYTSRSAQPVDVPSRNASPMVPQLGSHSRLLTVVGNSHFHLPGLEIIETYGGAALCHDVRMTELNRYLGISDAPSRTDRPIKTRSTRHELDAVSTLGFEHVARHCDLLLFHSRRAAERAQAETGAATAHLPFVPYRLPGPDQLSPHSREAARTRLGFQDHDLHVALLGGVDARTKASDVVIEALAWLAVWGRQAKLHIVGDLTHGPIDQLRELARSAGVSQRIQWHGRVSEQRYQDILLGVDVGVQIRLASLLSISGAAADLAAFGVPSVATEAMTEDMDLPAFVLRLSDDFSPLILAERILEASELRYSVGLSDQRQTYVREHSRDRYIQRLLAALGL